MAGILLDTHAGLWLLAAQALEEDLTLVSRDSIFDRYAIRRVW